MLVVVVVCWPATGNLLWLEPDRGVCIYTEPLGPVKQKVINGRSCRVGNDGHGAPIAPLELSGRLLLITN